MPGKLVDVPRGPFLVTLLVLFALLAGWAAIAPFDRRDWALENALVVLALALLFGSYSRLPLSRISYLLIFLFLCLHEVGSHYTYARVPYETWLQAITGAPLSERSGVERNHFDRFVHLVYGLLIAYPIREAVLRIAAVRGFWGYFIPLDVTMSTSMLYELIEWGAAEIFGGDLGVAYLGTQGDPWDAQKDMLLGTIGALISMTVTALINARYQRDFAREWAESLRVQRHRPLGEEELARRMRR